MCIMQRYAMAACGLIGLVAGLHNPKGRGLFLYAGLLAVAALAGGGVAARQSWLQWFPPSVSECGPGLEYMLESFPLASALPMIFRGAGDCSAIDWTFLGLSIANWSFVVFALILVSLTSFLLQRRTSRA
jgi:disulfide bond formation protein DsbB